MGLPSAMDWWDEWKLRVLVLCSLSVQFFLYFSGIVRTRYMLRKLRVMVWIAYISGDALAIYALATLFNRQKQQIADGSGGNSNTALEVIWAPVLLIHLGGQPFISAYSLEDIELWKRHVITLVSQVTVALYVFCKWWSGEKRLLQAAVLLFIIGIIRFSQKPWALRRASIRTMASTTNLSPRRRRDERSSSSAWRTLRTYLMEMSEEIQEEKINEVRYSLEEYVKQARELVNHGAKASDDAEKQAAELFNILHCAIKYVYQMFMDLSSPYSVRLHYLQYVLNFDYGYEHMIIGVWILRQFAIIYAKVRSSSTALGACSLFLLPGLALAAVVLFAKSGKDGYNKSDITVTYILFSGTAVLEFASYWFPLLRMSLTRCSNIEVYRWQDMVSQHNIMAFCARKKKPTTLMKLAAFSYLRDYINKHWYIWHEPEARRISTLVRLHVEYGWKECIHDAATYRRFSNLRGEQTLRKHHLLEQLLWTFDMPFDEYVLVWHVATDLCGFHYTSTASSSQGGGIVRESYDSCKIISNHMIYLLFICPEMLMLGTRQDLFMLACIDIFELMIKDEPAPTSSSLDERSMAQWILSRIMEQSSDDLLTKAPMISNAQKLAKALIDLDDDKMWEVIQGVWVEMLCYSASRSRGYEHAKSLADGGECLTNVWLLWSAMGMETLPDKMHNPGPPEPDHGEEQAPAALA